jgi:hypothetical protein
MYITKNIVKYRSNLSHLGVGPIGGNDVLKKHATITNGIQGHMPSKLEKLSDIMRTYHMLIILYP